MKARDAIVFPEVKVINKPTYEVEGRVFNDRESAEVVARCSYLTAVANHFTTGYFCEATFQQLHNLCRKDQNFAQVLRNLIEISQEGVVR